MIRSLQRRVPLLLTAVSETFHDSLEFTKELHLLARPVTLIVVSFILCVAAVIGLYVVMKFNLFQRARASFTRQRFRRLVVQDFEYDDPALG